MKRIAILTALILAAVSSFGQAARVDIPLQTSGPNVPISGGPLPQALWVANAAAYLCTHPSTTLVACQAHPITTYTDSTEGTTCPTATPLVQLPGNTCTAATGTTANVGFWYGGGLFDYWIVSSYGAYGPFSGNSGGSGGSSVWGGITGTLSNQTDLQTALNGKQASGNYLTALTGDCTATGPGAVAITCTKSGGTAFGTGAFATIANYLTIANAASTYAPIFTLTTTGTSGAATYSGNVLNIPQYAAGSGMLWPAGAGGIPNYTGLSTWGTTYSASNQIPANFLNLSSYLTSATAASTYEPLLGNPSTNGYLLSSTSAGVRSWVAPYTLPGTVVQTNQANTYTTGLQDFSSVTMRLPSSVTVGANSITLPASAGTVALVSQIGTWGSLNYPAWSSGTPFVKMTATGTFALDTNSYATTSQLPSTLSAVAHKWLNSYTSGTGLFTQTQPACGDLSDAGTGCSSAAYSLPGTVVQTNQANAYGAYLQDFSSATQVKHPVAAGYVALANGEMGYDSTNLNWHAWDNGADWLVGMMPKTGLTNNHCAEFSLSGNTWTLADAGGTCTTGGSMVWPTTAGIPYWTSGTAWGGAYNSSTPIPANYLPAALSSSTSINSTTIPASSTLAYLGAAAQTFMNGLTAPTFTSNVATGTAPFTVTSTTPVSNLSIGGNAATATSATTATNLSGTGVDSIPYQSASATTGYIASPTVNDYYAMGWNVTGSAAVPPTAINLSSIFSPIAGSSSLTTLGTITAGTWHGSVITSAYLPATTVYTGQANSFGAYTQSFAGSIADTAHSSFGANATVDYTNPVISSGLFPSYNVISAYEKSTTATGVNGIVNEVDWSPTVTPTKSPVALASDEEINFDSLSTVPSSVFANYLAVESAGATKGVQEMIGVLASANADGNAPVFFEVAAQANTGNFGTGTVSTAVSLDTNYISTSTGTTTNLRYLECETPQISGGGSVTNEVCLQIGTLNGTGTNYPIWVGDTHPSYFAGALIGNGFDVGSATSPVVVIPSTATGYTGSGNVVLSASPALTGTPTATTQTAGDNSTKLATTAYVATAVTNGAYTLPSQYKTWSCEPGLGDGLNAITAGTYLQSTCWNKTGATVTLTGVGCFTDNAGSSTLNAAGNTLGALLTGAVTCTSSLASGTQSSNVLLTNGDYIKFTFVADGTSKQTTFVVTGSY